MHRACTRWLAAVSAAALLCAAVPAWAQHAHGLIAEERAEHTAQDPLRLEIGYTAELAANVAGGNATGARYLDNLDVILDADLGALAGWQGAELRLYGLYNNGASISGLAGDALAVSNIEAGTQAVRLYEAWISQRLTPSLSVKLGLYDLNSEFDALEASGLFVGSGHGIGADISQTGLNGPSIFPVTSLAVRVDKALPSGLTLRAAVLDAVPGDPVHPGRTAVRLNSREGLLAIAEAEVRLPKGKLLIGHWRYSAQFDDLTGSASGGNAGTYLRGESTLAERGTLKVDGFFRLGKANGRINMFSHFASAGLKFSGLTAAVEDEAGIAVASAWTSSAYRLATTARASELAFEATYRRRVLPFLTLQPWAQYVRNPSADPAIRDALVLGLRAEVGFGL